ncbi:YraN family protein [Zunongwangia sp. H14]|uniref:YraN family protein n=1 Tax=Zunongwangia sp. H14 TaxID=3240792 RepID=UPI0035655889
MAKHNLLGKSGEDLAAEFLQRNGYTILTRNFRYQKAEVDIIARTDKELIAVEVKTRSTPDFGDPQEFVKQKQIQQLLKAVDHFVEEQELDLEVRFDIVAIIKNKAGTKIEHLKDAFYHF